MAQRKILRGQVVTPDQLIEDGIVVFSDTIELVAPAESCLRAGTDVLEKYPDDSVERVSGYILPGLVDVHCHGGGGESFPNAVSAEAAQVAIDEHRRHGTTSLVASLVTADPQTLRERAAVLTQLCHSGELAGIHFEGPFVSEVRCGAQDPTYIIAPDADLTRELTEICGGYCVTMTVAPEKPGAYGEGSVAEALIEGGALPSWGHTDAGPEATRKALKYSRDKLAHTPDARSPHVTATHLFNGMRTIHHRDPGPVPEFLGDAARDGVIVELICDGVHLSLDLVRSIYETLGRERIVLVTDAMAAAGMADGSYQLGPQAVTVREGVARLEDGDSIAGGTSHLLDQVRLLVKQVGLPLVDVTYMAATQGAQIIGDSNIGALREGGRADLLVCDEQLQVNTVYRGGVAVSE